MNNYEKKYKEALARMKSWARGEHPECFTEAQKAAEFIFPELKESDDERIRKRIIHALHGDVLDMEETTKAIAWLEKQGESDETKAKIFLINKGYPIDANGIIPTYEEMYNIIREGLEEQGEQKPQGKSALEAINEEKVDNANKVEPKFHKNEWIITKANNLYQVTAIIDGKYRLKYGDNYTVQKCVDVDRCARLWDITKDAKEGDVLVASDESLFIFARAKDNAAYYHFSLCKNGSQEISDGKYAWEVAESCHPATKEQRDKLEKTMADAGYTFDFEREELKKIEDEIEIPYGAKDSELQEATYYIPKGFHAEIDEDKVVIKKGEKPTEWSEEDEGILDEIIDFLENGTVKLQHDLSLYASWLKSLKYRYTWKPSDEQMAALNNAILLNEDHYNGAVLSTLREQLKKLK